MYRQALPLMTLVSGHDLSAEEGSASRVTACKAPSRLALLGYTVLRMFNPTSILLLCMLANIASASAQEAENALKEFEGKVVIFRHPLRDDSPRVRR